MNSVFSYLFLESLYPINDNNFYWVSSLCIEYVLVHLFDTQVADAVIDFQRLILDLIDKTTHSLGAVRHGYGCHLLVSAFLTEQACVYNFLRLLLLGLKLAALGVTLRLVAVAVASGRVEVIYVA